MAERLTREELDAIDSLHLPSSARGITQCAYCGVWPCSGHRLRTHIDAVEEELVESQARGRMMEDMLEKAEKLVNDAGDWRQSEGRRLSFLQDVHKWREETSTLRH